ncbi:MAG TPA: GAF domain-containing protein, partial [Elusimicrobiales bacterium]|nr:GAF domain-containing protein [Elusimicrobiales bacterium]
VTPEEVWKKLVEFAGSNMKCEAGSYFSVDEKEKMLTLEHAFGDFAGDISNLSFSFQGIVGWCAEHKAPIIVNDVQTNPKFCVKVDKATGFTTKTVLAVPVLDGQAVVGVLELMNRSFYHSGVFSEEDRDTLEMLVFMGLKMSKSIAKAALPPPP